MDNRMRCLALFVTLFVSVACPTVARAHPVPRRAHDRTIEVRLEPQRVVVAYRLEVDQLTVLLDDLPAVDDQADTKAFTKPDQFYDAFTRCYAPILAGNLTSKLDGKPLDLKCTKRGHRLTDEENKPLDHLRCDFVFEAKWELAADAKHTFDFREGNYELETGMIRLSLTAPSGINLLETSQPDKALQEQQARDLKPGDDARLRKASAVFDLPTKPEGESSSPRGPAADPIPESGDNHHEGLLDLLFDTRRGLWLLLLIAAGFGAAHALTPGHGKTLVAAYLVGERGTVWHAVLLGIATTLSHTGVVIVAALILLIWRVNIERGLELVSGLLITVLGFWLFLRRVSGGSDHLHVGGHSHGHGVYHTHGDGAEPHTHDHDAPVLGTWGIIMLGIAGGIVPCWDAIFLLGVALSKQMAWLALPLVLAFSAGLAATLVAVGIGVVYIKGFSESRWGQGRITRVLPLVSAALIFGMGLWMCYRSVHRGA
jgi:ABC-type nickel/cobalt efflux system permease component RcnA